MRILAVGVEEELSRSIATNLRVIVDESYDVDDSSNFLRFRNYDLILLDYDLEFNKTNKFITRISKNLKVPLIILSVVDDKETEIAFLKAGADDFVKEPFDTDIICARVEAKLRRTIDNRIKIGKLTIDIGEEKTSYKDKEIEIKGKPFDILVYLAEHKNQVISKDRFPTGLSSISLSTNIFWYFSCVSRLKATLLHSLIQLLLAASRLFNGLHVN